MTVDMSIADPMTVERARLKLSRQTLLREEAHVGGQWIRAADGRTLDVTNPATGRIIGSVPILDEADTRRAISSAHQALQLWRKRVAADRAWILRRWFDLITRNAEDLARILTAEQGKPLAEAKGEITYAASYVEWFAEEARRIDGDILTPHRGDARILVTKEPVGVVAAITPWNFPAAMITRKVAAALAAGCTVVLKPSELTPFTALALAALAEEAGLPAGAFNVVTGEPRVIGSVLTSDPTVRKLTFTGSTSVGKQLAAACAGTMKRVTMELGGNAPFIVFDDADLDQALEGVIASKYRNTGQTCVCANRILVHSWIYDTFAKKLANNVRTMRIGDGLTGATDLGPLINESAVEKVEAHVADAVKKGATVLTGGQRAPEGGTFYLPTVLTHATAAMRLAEEETFGPIAPLFRFETEQEAIALANATSAGLAAYAYTKDGARQWRLSERLEYGMVGINTGMISTAVAPFGGIKESGYGREGSKYGIQDYLETKYTCVGGLT